MAALWCVLAAVVSCSYVFAHIPVNDFELAESDGAVYYTPSRVPALTRQESEARVTALRNVMSQHGVQAYIVPTADAHGSAYLAAADARREWLSGLSGSSGTALVSRTSALLWTDARYWTQFDMQVNDTVWTLMRQGVDPSLQSWLSSNMPSGSVVGVDPTTYTYSAWASLENTLRPSGVTLRAISQNLVDLARVAVNDPAPPRPAYPLIVQELRFTGQTSSEKISILRTRLTCNRAAAVVLTALDDIAYTLNLRGSDIPFNPVFFSYLVVRNDVPSPYNIMLFWGNGELPPEVQAHLIGELTILLVRPYDQIFSYLADMSNEIPEGSTIWVPDGASYAIYTAARTNPSINIITTLSPVALIKCIKNNVELAGFRSAHIRDGTAVVRFMRWIHEQVDTGRNVTEIQVSDRLEALRGEEEYFVGPSFATIAGAGENGAVIHYRPSREGPQRAVAAGDMLLVDSGGQYRDGTTDITRTRHMSTPTVAQVRAFTRVLKGQIALATAVFPAGIVGHRLETLARKSLWDVGLNYGHGTGHGIGHFLNVHEGPSWILSGPSPTDPGIQAGMIFSNEPGFYEVNQYGIRHEDVMEVVDLRYFTDHIQSAGLVGDFEGAGALAFNTISLAPHQVSSLDIDLLTDFEIKYLNDYHARVLSTIGGILLSRDLHLDYQWLEKECAPIKRSGANVVKFAPILALISAFSLWFNL